MTKISSEMLELTKLTAAVIRLLKEEGDHITTEQEVDIMAVLIPSIVLRSFVAIFHDIAGPLMEKYPEGKPENTERFIQALLKFVMDADEQSAEGFRQLHNLMLLFPSMQDAHAREEISKWVTTDHR